MSNREKYPDNEFLWKGFRKGQVGLLQDMPYMDSEFFLAQLCYNLLLGKNDVGFLGNNKPQDIQIQSLTTGCDVPQVCRTKVLLNRAHNKKEVDRVDKYYTAVPLSLLESCIIFNRNEIDEEVVQSLEKYAAKADFMIVDSIESQFIGDKNSSAEIGAFIDIYKNMAKKNNCGILLLNTFHNDFVDAEPHTKFCELLQNAVDYFIKLSYCKDLEKAHFANNSTENTNIIKLTNSLGETVFFYRSDYLDLYHLICEACE